MVNGTLQYKTVTGGGLDENGDPIPVNATWSEIIECFIGPNINKRKYKDRTFSMPTYEILIDMQPFDSAMIKLTTKRGKEMGEFQVQAIQFLDVVKRVKITV